jgi:hypothetical protein
MAPWLVHDWEVHAVKKKKLKASLDAANAAYSVIVSDLAVEKSAHVKTTAQILLANVRVDDTRRMYRQFCERVAQRISSASSTADDVYRDLDAFLVAQDACISEARSHGDLDNEYYPDDGLSRRKWLKCPIRKTLLIEALEYSWLKSGHEHR